MHTDDRLARLGGTIDTIQTRDDLVAFIAALADLSPGFRENRTLSDYLEALAGFTQDLDGFYANRGQAVPDQPTWSDLAHMLYAATLYE